MIRRIQECRFRIGKYGVKHPIKRMWDAADAETRSLASGVDPRSAVCCRCKHELDWHDLQGQDLMKVSCSNCYSQRLMLTSVIFELGWKEAYRG